MLRAIRAQYNNDEAWRTEPPRKTGTPNNLHPEPVQELTLQQTPGFQGKHSLLQALPETAPQGHPPEHARRAVFARRGVGQTPLAHVRGSPEGGQAQEVIAASLDCARALTADAPSRKC
jgi:hypothetical protein